MLQRLSERSEERQERVEAMAAGLYKLQSQHEQRINMLQRLSERSEEKQERVEATLEKVGATLERVETTLERVEATQTVVVELLQVHEKRLDRLELKAIEEPPQHAI